METHIDRSPALAWRALACVDALLLAYVTWNAPWGFIFTSGMKGDYAVLAIPITFAIDVAWNVTAAAFVAAVGYAIARDVQGPWRPRRPYAVLPSIATFAIIALAAWMAHHEVARLLDVIPQKDRVKVFEALAFTNAKGESSGARLVWLAAAAYLGEKYLLRWWNVRWPVSIVAVVMLAWPLAAALQGESRERQWVASQEWRALGEGKTWLQATQGCAALGNGWRLPRSHELPPYLATEPESTRGLKENLWTPVTIERGHAAIVVSPRPRRAGTWRSNEIPHRDRSTCEVDSLYSGRPGDWFASLTPRLCASAPLSESMFVSTEQPLATLRGYRETEGGGRDWMADQTTGAAICMKPSGEALKPQRRRFPKEEEFNDAAAFLDRMRAACGGRVVRYDAAACAAFGRQEPATNATAG